MKSKQNFPKLKSKALLSPMSRITDVAFRHLSRKYGAGLTTTELISSAGILRNNNLSKKMLITSPLEKPSAVQLFGSKSDEIIQAGKILQEKFDIIDFNCGCPVWKVVKTGAGSALLNNPKKLSSILNKLVAEVDVPVSAKIRLGIDYKTNALTLAKQIEDAGVSALSVHGRTQKQKYSGRADWEMIRRIKEKLSIPVIGNGDVFTPEIFKKRLEESNVDYILIGRGAIGNPYLFSQINDFLKKGSYQQPKKYALITEYIDLAQKYDLSFPSIKSQAIFFTKGIENSSNLRVNIQNAKNITEINSIIINKIKEIKK